MIESIKDMKYDIEMTMALNCYNLQKQANIDGVDFKCTCEDPYKWSDEEVIKYYKENCK